MERCISLTQSILGSLVHPGIWIGLMVYIIEASVPLIQSILGCPGHTGIVFIIQYKDPLNLIQSILECLGWS